MTNIDIAKSYIKAVQANDQATLGGLLCCAELTGLTRKMLHGCLLNH